MLTILCVSFLKPPCASVASVFQLIQFEVLELSFQTAVQWVVAEVVGCSGGGGGVDEMAPESAGLWGCDVRCVSLLAFLPYFLGVHSTSLLYAPHGSRRPSLTHARTVLHTHKSKHTPQQPTWEESGCKSTGTFRLQLAWKAWWQLIVVVAAVVVVCGSAEQSIENRHIYLLYIAYVAACLPKMNEVIMSSLVLQKRSPATKKKI